MTKALILGPLERMRIIMQVKSLANFVNPNDRPKNALDLFHSNLFYNLLLFRDWKRSRTACLLQRH